MNAIADAYQVRAYDALESVPRLRIKRRIYVASSWRNTHQPRIVEHLQKAGHQVYDFRSPRPDNDGFRWRDANPNGADTIGTFLEALRSPVAERGYGFDKEALDWADTVVMVLPCGRSAHLEAGYACGQGKHVIWWLHTDRFEPELMYMLGNDFVIGSDRHV